MTRALRQRALRRGRGAYGPGRVLVRAAAAHNRSHSNADEPRVGLRRGRRVGVIGAVRIQLFPESRTEYSERARSAGVSRGRAGGGVERRTVERTPGKAGKYFPGDLECAREPRSGSRQDYASRIQTWKISCRLG